MPEIEVEANELTDADVERVSLVKRGANRLPFRITKSEGPDVIRFDRIFKREAAKPTIVAFAVSKTADLEKAKARITAAGFSVEKIESGKDGHLVRQVEGAPLEGAIVVKFDEDVAAIVQNVDLAKNDFTKTADTFLKDAVAEGIVPSARIAGDLFAAHVRDIFAKAETPDSACGLLEKAVKDYGTYLLGVVRAMPVQTFKMDEVKVETSPASAAPASTEAGEVKKTDAGTDAGEQAASAGATETKKSEGEAGTKDDEAKVTKSEPEKTEAQFSGEALLIKFREMLDGISTGLGVQIKKSQEATELSISKLDARINSVEEVAKSAQKTVKSAVLGDAGDDPATAKGKSNGVSKGDEWDGPLIDTAYLHRS